MNKAICILAVVLIHSLHNTGSDEGLVLIRQMINFAVATFVFMSGYRFRVKSDSDRVKMRTGNI